MTLLRRRMIEDMELRNDSKATIRCYVQAVARFARHHGRSPTQLDQQAVRGYLLHLIHEQRISWAHYNVTVCALRFLYRVTLGKNWRVEQLPYAKRPKTLPSVITDQEFLRLLKCVRQLKHRICDATVGQRGGSLHDSADSGPQPLEYHGLIHARLPACPENFFLPVRVLSRLFRGKFLHQVRQAYDRGDLSFHGNLAQHHGQHWRTMTLQATEFIRRFLLHVLPRGFVRIRYSGFMANCHREAIRHLMKSTPSLSHEATTRNAAHVCSRGSRGARDNRRPSSPTAPIRTTDEVLIRLSKLLTHPHHVLSHARTAQPQAARPRRP